ncbi:interferon-related developmental regulator 1-like [Orbicella faveolata]|uniref:interferon-related developmental regulator 1-like n=1 Tax=Orbicella faveolata TaxID=48498 RepID=UPI0009E49C4C|nr:interferon-related developmental regulator 1-like [Orbicella faveolata]
MPKNGDSKGKGRGKRGTQQPRKKGRRTGDESDDEDLENQSIASHPSTGTHSGDEVDGFDEGGELELEDDFEQILADNIDGATQRSSRERQCALIAVQKALKSRIVSEFISDRKITILDCIEKCVKRGTPEDRVLASSIAALLCVQLGAGSESQVVFKTLKPHLITVIQDKTAASASRSSCGTALALCCFIASEDPDELFECLNVLEGIFDNKKTVKANEVEVYSNILLAWALLLSVTPSEQAYQLINKHLRRMTNLLETNDLNVRIAAGESLALMYEMARDFNRDFIGDSNGLCDLLRDLATDGNKHKAKKDLRQQRSSFRDILKTVEDGISPDEVVKFGTENMQLQSWVQRRQYTALKDVLGTGVTVHLQENDLLRDIFDLGPQVKSSEVQKTSRYQRQLYNNAVSKARTLVRGKNRDKRNALSMY